MSNIRFLKSDVFFYQSLCPKALYTWISLCKTFTESFVPEYEILKEKIEAMYTCYDVELLVTAEAADGCSSHDDVLHALAVGSGESLMARAVYNNMMEFAKIRG